MILTKLEITLYPICLQATCPSAAPNPSLQITPHVLLWKISRRPLSVVPPPISRSDLSAKVELTLHSDLFPTLGNRLGE